METNKNLTIDYFKKDVKIVDISTYQNQYNVKKHEIFTNFAKYPDAEIDVALTDAFGNPVLDQDGKPKTTKSIKKINRVGLAYQKRIVDIAVMFQTAVPYKYTSEVTPVFDAFKKVIEENKMSFSDSEICKKCKRYTQVAELWYLVEEPNESYGFNSEFRLRHKVLSPEKYKLYPKFDDNDNLIAFSFESQQNDKTVFQAFTAEKIYIFTTEKGNTTVEERINAIGKIPVVFYEQEFPEWDSVQHLIEIAEEQRTYFSESNKKFGEPILMLSGSVEGSDSGKRGGKVFQVENGGNVQFVVPPNANENFNTEIQLNRRDIHEFTHTPDLSDEFYSGKGNMLSGVGRKLTWLPAHLKVKDNERIFIPALQRRVNIILAFLSEMNKSFEKDIKNQKITPIITPFDIDDDTEMIRTLMEANGNKPLISQRESMQRFGITNPEEQIKQLQQEETKDLNESFS